LDQSLIEDYENEAKEKPVNPETLQMHVKTEDETEAVQFDNYDKMDGGNLTELLDGPIFSMETILGKRQREDSTEYLVKWEGRSKNFNSWVSEESIQIGSKPKQKTPEAKVDVASKIVSDDPEPKLPKLSETEASTNTTENITMAKRSREKFDAVEKQSEAMFSSSNEDLSWDTKSDKSSFKNQGKVKKS